MVTQSVIIAADELRTLIKEEVINALAQLEFNTQQNQTPKFYSRKEVITMLKISPNTLTNWAKNDTLKPHYIGGRCLYKEEDIDSAMIKM
ncbi:helix-turn-helix domain-containing protein [Leeuwenhoekiella palythoae]|uniref:helix-turn-helix domain-containing protein n=1 Tax=Leeuwenhoekiella palythoae TaxID=573501 RepID=UPI003513252D